MKKKITAFAAMAALFAATAAYAFPDRPIQIIVPYSAGGSTDLSMRILAESLQRHIPGIDRHYSQPAGRRRCHRHLGSPSQSAGRIYAWFRRAGPSGAAAASWWHRLHPW